MSRWLLWVAGGCSSYERQLDQASSPAPLDQALSPAASPPVDAVGGQVDADEMLAVDGRFGGNFGAATTAAAPEPPSPPTEQRTRSWFPEAFLWRPIVVTGDDGRATVNVTVPDALTTWRVLALSHDRAGRQAGASTTFDGTLPLYVEPVVPGWLYDGDRISLAVQTVNTTASTITAALEIHGEGALRGSGSTRLVLGPADSDVKAIAMEAVGAGTAKVVTRLSGERAGDASERVVPVFAAGRPVVTVQSGTLASARTVELEVPFGSDPDTEQIEVSVYPGPLSVLGAELERISAGARPDNAAYGLAVAGVAGRLASTVGVELDPAAVRRIRILAHQRLVYLARAPASETAAALLAALALAAPDPDDDELRQRLTDAVVQGQRADGTWSRSERSTLQQVLVQTAFAARALPESAGSARLRASGALERHLREVDDPYTASVLVASGLLDADLADELRAKVTTKELPSGIASVAGTRPTDAEVEAWAILALAPGPPRAELAAQLMARWDAMNGFGAGSADPIALEAVVAGLGAPLGPVDLTLRRGDTTLSAARLDPRQPKVPVTLTAGAGAGPLTLTASPAVPGLVYVATRRSWVPWSDAQPPSGVEVRVSASALAIGRRGTLSIAISAPSGATVHVEQGIPAGTLLDDDAASAASAVGATVSARTDRIVVDTRPFFAGEVQELALSVIPAFSGRFQTVPLTISVDGGPPALLRPLIWSVGG